MSREIKLGVVGFGPRGLSMSDICVNGFKHVKLTAICDNSAEALKSAADKYPDVKQYEDFEQMLKTSGIEAVLVETPADNHARFCAMALKHGVHVFSDIPSVASLEESDMLWKATADSKAMFMTGANPNFWGFIEAAVDLNKKGLLGVPYYLEAEYIHCLNRDPFKTTTTWRTTLPPIKYCTHSLGPLLRLIPEDLRYVSCVSTGSHVHKYPGQQDLMTAHFRTESNVVVRLTVSFVNNAHIGYHSYRVFGTEGYFERSSGRGEIEKSHVMFSSNKLYGAHNLTELNVGYMPNEYANNPLATGHGGADYAMFDNFFKAIENNTPSPVSLREGLRMTLPGIYANESAVSGGKTIRISYPWEK